MDSPLYRATVFVLYQFSLLIGIMLLPVALVTHRIGFRLPMDRVVDRLGTAYENATVDPQ